jgi:hypothetical protein
MAETGGLKHALADAWHRPRNSSRFLRYVAAHWEQLEEMRAFLDRRPERVSKVLQEAERRALAHPEPITEADGRSDLLRAWTTLLLESSSHVQREEQQQAAGPGD